MVERNAGNDFRLAGKQGCSPCFRFLDAVVFQDFDGSGGIQ